MGEIMNAKEQSKAAASFAEYWRDRGYEKGESKKFWLELLSQVFGVDYPSHFLYLNSR